MNAPAWASGLIIPEERALQERRAQIKPEYSIRGMIVASIFECLRRAQGQAAADAAMSESGLTLEKMGAMRKLAFADFHDARSIIATRLAPSLGGYEAASARIGAMCLETFFESVAGKTMMLLAGKDPHRLMGAAPNGYSLAIEDGGKRHYVKTGEKTGVFTFQHDLLGPCHEIGTFSAAIRVVCGIEIRVKVAQTALSDFVLHIDW